MFDRTGHGYITSSDLRSVLQCLGEQLNEDESQSHYFIFFINFYIKNLFQIQVEDMIEEVDIDGDGN